MQLLDHKFGDDGVSVTFLARFDMCNAEGIRCSGFHIRTY